MAGGGEIPKVPDLGDTNRHVRAHAVIAQALNDLLQSGALTHNPDGSFSLTPSPAPSASFPPSGVFDSGSDQDETKLMPGPPGAAGATGATGPTGPTGPAGSGGGGMMPSDFEVDELPRPTGLLAVHDYDLLLADITTNNVTIARHGLTPKLPNDATQYLDGSGAYSIPAGTGATSANIKFALRAALYLPFTTGTNAYEFEGSDLAAFTAVDPGTNTPTTTESNDVLSIASPGSDSANVLHSWMKTATINANDYVEAWVSCTARSSGTQSIGVIMSDGHTYGAGTQMKFQLSSTQSSFLNLITNFNTVGSGGSQNIQFGWMSGIGIRLKYLGSNNWEGYISLDGVTWCLVQAQTKTLTPAEFGFFVTNTAVSIPANFTVHYVRKGS